ncbi:23700_t:CDS:2, partial [Racocetra persica]
MPNGGMPVTLTYALHRFRTPGSYARRTVEKIMQPEIAVVVVAKMLGQFVYDISLFSNDT